MKLKEYKIKLKELKNYIIAACEYIKEEINNYNIIYDYIIDYIDNLNNYESINNIINFKMDKLMKEIDDFLNQNHINKIKNILNKYENNINELSIIYNKDEKIIRIFGSEFVKNNKGKCYLLIFNKKSELIEEIDCDNYYNNNKERKIKIRIIEKKKSFIIFRK